MNQLQRYLVIFCAFLCLGSFAYSRVDIPLNNFDESDSETYAPGVGEYMLALQTRHIKLWFAGLSKNWELANYEIDELEEGIEDLVKFHPIYNKEVPLENVIEKYLDKPLKNLRTAIDKKNNTEFNKSFDSLTKGCNACHVEENHSFIVIQRPSTNPFSNQKF
jgi:hypothetical protein